MFRVIYTLGMQLRLSLFILYHFAAITRTMLDMCDSTLHNKTLTLLLVVNV